MITKKITHKNVPTKTGYILPFKFKSPNEVRIAQGYHGPYSRDIIEWPWVKGAENKYGVDFNLPFDDLVRSSDNRYGLNFELPFGTPVLASKSGVVFRTRNSNDSFYEGLDFSKGIRANPNYAIIKDKDGLMTTYQNLGRGEVYVEPGQEIQQGEVIAKTGKSGWLGPLPNLFFEVWSSEDGFKKTYPVKFGNYNGPLDHFELIGLDLRLDE